MKVGTHNDAYELFVTPKIGVLSPSMTQPEFAVTSKDEV